MLSEVIEVNGTKKLRPLAGNYINNDEKNLLCYSTVAVIPHIL